MIRLIAPIEWPPNAKRKPDPPDLRMVHCVLGSYTECPAIIPEACICGKLPYHVYLAKLRAKDGFAV